MSVIGLGTLKLLIGLVLTIVATYYFGNGVNGLLTKNKDTDAITKNFTGAFFVTIMSLAVAMQ